MSMQRRIWTAVAMVGIGALALSGCAASGSNQAADKFTIGLVEIDLQDPDLAVMTKAMKEEADKLGVELVVGDSKKDVATELTQVEDMITKKVDAIIIQPLDGDASQKAAEAAIAAGIPLFTLSTEFSDGATIDLKSYIGVDDTLAGEMQAEYLNELLPDGGPIILAAGTYGASWTDRRVTGLKNKLNANIKIVDEFQADGSRDKAKTKMEDVLQRYPSGQIVAVVANNDEMALGAASAIADAGRTSEFKVLGVDGTAPAVEAIANGEMAATVRQESAAQGVKAVQVVLDFLNGKPIEKRYTLPFVLINSDNVADYK
ncbi:MAG: sugar ABC transporter substrate-binding protein [Agromyces sp.]